MARGFGDLPENVVVEIMSRLPPECLVQLKLVNKSWCSLIDKLIKNRQWFVPKHLVNFGSKSSPLLFLTGDWLLEIVDVSETILYFFTENQLVTSYKLCDENDQIHFDTLFLRSILRSGFVEATYRTSHCNGIIFQTERETNDILLCNPTTRKKFRLLDNVSSCFSRSGFKTLVSGLGYDAIDRVYKVVRVVNLPSADGIIKYSCFGAEVCTLDSNQGEPCWREIRMMINIGNHLTVYTGNAVLHRGLLYWVLCHEKRPSPDERMILSFDLHTEEFRIVPQPDDVVNKPMEFDSVSAVSVGEYRVTRVRMGLWLGLWKQRLTLLKYVDETIPWEAQGISRPVEMWTIKEDEEEEEERCLWLKHDTFFPYSKIFIPRAFWKSDELLLGISEEDHSVSYNLRTRKIRTVKLSSETPFWFLSVFSYVKSFVSFNY